MRGRSLLLCGSAAISATVLLAFGATSGAAAPPVQHYHYSFTCTSTPAAPADPNDCIGADSFGQPAPVEIDPELCDIPGTKVDHASGNVQVFADGTAKIEGKEIYSFTSALTGKSIESRSEEQQTTNVIDNGDGTISLVFAFKGLEQQLKLPNGSMLMREAGPVTFTLTLKAVTFEFVSFTVSERGPHPDIESGGDLFCAVVVPALS
jgi:hypothetical protein